MKKFNIPLNLAEEYVVSETPAGSEPLHVERIIDEIKRPIIYVTANREKQERFIEGCDFLCPNVNVEALPAWDCLPYDRLFPSPGIIAKRAKTLTNIANNLTNIDVLAVTVSSTLQLIPSPKYFKGRYLELLVGRKINRERFLANIVEFGFRSVATVFEPGEFSIRGGIIDIFPISEKNPVRIDFFGDVIDGIRYFDINSQISSRSLDKVLLTSLMELSFDKSSKSTFRSNYRSLFGGVKTNDQIYHSVTEGQYVQGLEHMLPLFFDQLYSIFDYFSNPLVIFEDNIHNKFREHEKLIKNQFALRQEEMVLNSPTVQEKIVPIKSMFLDYQCVIEKSLKFGLISFKEGAEPPSKNSEKSGFKYSRDFTKERKDMNSSVIISLRDYIQSLLGSRTVFLIAYSKKSAERLSLLLQESGLEKVTFIDNFEESRKLNCNLFVGISTFEKGFSDENFHIITEQDALGERLIRKQKKNPTSVESLRFANEIAVNELVVHLDHGVGKYVGLEVINAASSRHECLAIKYLGDDRLLLPIANIELLSKYGSDHTTLDKLGSASWQARKAKLAEKLNEVAEQLIEIAAKRALNQAPIMSVPDTGWHEFCSEFPYQETADQENAINDIIKDFTLGTPADRLICGDVGFGKTEIALRAAFIAVKNFKQVAVVVPTTILSNQHFKNFLNRFRKTGVRVGQISRLVSSSERKKTKVSVSKGELDILVGTHAILEKSVSFLNLGLVIIDEEQQFGVMDKEKLKKFTRGVHILSLTATPIPRTLQQAFTGLREMSLIMTPPADRISVQTYNISFDKIAICEALTREKKRGGQSFFIVPRISDIDEIKIFLTERAPDLSFVIAHGQMGSSVLEKNMEGFYLGNFDILLATTIAQSGLDIPSANTIIIYNADYYGLAQLYQLRGRVGRSKIRSYAYLVTQREKDISDIAMKRLKLVASLQDLGSGFSLASHDLDMRGAGNLLGDEQSGHIKEVGFELYQQMLKTQIDNLKSKNTKESLATEIWSPQINLGTSSLIPEKYIGDLGVRLSTYQRLASVKNFKDYGDIINELSDRFGDPPSEVYILVELMKIKNLCKKAGVVKLDAGQKGASISFLNESFANPEGLISLIRANESSLKVKNGRLIIVRNWKEENKRIKEVKYFLRKIVNLVA